MTKHYSSIKSVALTHFWGRLDGGLNVEHSHGKKYNFSTSFGYKNLQLTTLRNRGYLIKRVKREGFATKPEKSACTWLHQFPNVRKRIEPTGILKIQEINNILLRKKLGQGQSETWDVFYLDYMRKFLDSETSQNF